MDAKKVFRCLLQELCFATPSNKTSLMRRYIMAQYKKLITTDEQLCKARNEALYLGQTYLSYLSSQRKSRELQSFYKGKGERTTKETADIVGFKLPTDPN